MSNEPMDGLAVCRHELEEIRVQLTQAHKAMMALEVEVRRGHAMLEAAAAEKQQLRSTADALCSERDTALSQLTQVREARAALEGEVFDLQSKLQHMTAARDLERHHVDALELRAFRAAAATEQAETELAHVAEMIDNLLCDEEHFLGFPLVGQEELNTLRSWLAESRQPH